MSDPSAKSKTPAIRFKGFSGEWVESQLGHLIEITSASRVHKNDWNESGVPFFRTSDVVSNFKGIENNKAYISFELYEKLIAKSGKVKKNDILVTGGGSIGIPYLIESDKPIYFKDADLLWLKGSKDINGIYLYMFFLTSTFRKFVSSITHIGTISHYTIEQAKATPITIPNKKEQTQIGNFFQQLDRLIAQHQQKHDKLRCVKKALLEKMFPKQGETQPAIRFKGFSEAWEEKALGGLTSITIGEFVIKTKQHPKSPYPVYNGGKSHTGFYDEFNNEGNKIVISARGANAGFVNIEKGRYWAGNSCYSVGVLENDIFYIDYIYQYIKKNQNKFTDFQQAANIPAVSKSDVETFKIEHPNLEEQTKIGNLFQQLDSLINQHQSQLTKLGNIKQAMLAKMFV